MLIRWIGVVLLQPRYFINSWYSWYSWAFCMRWPRVITWHWSTHSQRQQIIIVRTKRTNGKREQRKKQWKFRHCQGYFPWLSWLSYIAKRWYYVTISRKMSQLSCLMNLFFLLLPRFLIPFRELNKWFCNSVLKLSAAQNILVVNLWVYAIQ